MKKAENLLEKIADPDNLRLAAWKAAKGKRHSPEVLQYFSEMENELPRLLQQILSGEVEVGNYRFFKVFEPKERQICASPFAQQVLHHALMNCCHDRFERAQIHDSYASRKNKGTYAALDRARFFSHRHEWFLKLDVRKFFESIHHEVLKKQLEALFSERDLLLIFSKIIESYDSTPPLDLERGQGGEVSRGLPIGNLTSQYFANHYLAPLDHFIKERLQIKSYVRYMDDLVLWHDEKPILKNARSEIANFAENKLRCSLKPAALNRTANGLPFLGYHIFPHHARLLQKSKIRLFRKMKTLAENHRSGAWHEAKCQRRALPLLAFARHADCEILLKNLILRLEGQSP